MYLYVIKTKTSCIIALKIIYHFGYNRTQSSCPVSFSPLGDISPVMDNLRGPGILLEALKAKCLDEGAKELKVYQVNHLRNDKYATPVCVFVRAIN